MSKKDKKQDEEEVEYGPGEGDYATRPGCGTMILVYAFMTSAIIAALTQVMA